MLAASVKRVFTPKHACTRSFAHRVKMVLKEDVESVGVKGQQVSVKAGFARNYLYPQKFAVYATKENLAKYKASVEDVDEGALAKQRQEQRMVQKLESIELEFRRHTPDRNERLLQNNVSAEQIVEALEKKHGLIVGLARVQLPNPIKTVGTHVVHIRVDDKLVEEYNAKQQGQAALEQAEAQAGEQQPLFTPEETDAKKNEKKPFSPKREAKLTVVVTRR